MNQTKQNDLPILVSLCAVMVVPVYLYGPRPLVISFWAVVTALICDLLFKKLFHYPRKKGDLSSVTAALSLALMLPATVDYQVVVIGVFVGLLLAKYVFGGTGNHIFHPAALGLAVVSLSFSDQVFSFPTPKTVLSLEASIWKNPDIVYATSPASILNVEGTPRIDWFDVLLGNFAGAMGATCILALCGVLLFLCIRRIISYKIVLTSLLTVTVYATLFPRALVGWRYSVVYELISGVFLFALAFLACDQALTPQKTSGQILYGISLALLVMIFRTVGALDVEVVFVLLLMNALSHEFDRYGDGLCSALASGSAFLVRGCKHLREKIIAHGEENKRKEAGDHNA